MIAQSETEK